MPARARLLLLVAGVGLGLLAGACGDKAAPRAVVDDAGRPVPPRPAGCPATAVAPPALPGVDADATALDAWLARARDLDGELLTPAELRTLGGAGADGKPALTRRAWLGAALGALGGAGDPVATTLAALGLPASGSFTIDLAAVAAPTEKEVLLDAAADAGVVLLEAGAHRLLLLGRDGGGVLRVVHAPADYAAPCDPAGAAETRFTVGRPVLSGLDLGAGSSDGTLLGRLTRAVVFARARGPGLVGVAEARAAAPITVPTVEACTDSAAAAIFFSPAVPNQHQPLRVIATLSHDPGPSELVLLDPTGNRLAPTMTRLDGPPWTTVVTIDAPTPGTWTAALGDGARVDACQQTEVRVERAPRGGGSGGPAWSLRRKHGEATENLFAAFVQRLFDYPLDQDLSWPEFHSVLRDRDHNLLYDHLSLDEEVALELEPDCADLPYLLRAYFAWKLGLPFSYRRCTRGYKGGPPRCDRQDDDPLRQPSDNLVPRAELEARGSVEAFQALARRMFSTVSSSSGRTLPGDDATDWYPVPLTRAALRPGTMFADPYGHLIVIAGWYPQKPGGYGLLMGVDAQPDATIGRRRFWRGNYLFVAETTGGGAGFKAFRPRFRSDGVIEAKANAALAQPGWWVPYSGQQYAGSTDDFYDAMEGLINPRPLDASQMQVALVDALAEQVVRRVKSVDVGEAYMKTATEVVAMPEGAAIFLTSGPWEDFATPSRDHRILVAIDTVLGFPKAVERNPARYRTTAADLPATLARLASELAELLQAKTLTYTRSDGSPQVLSMADVIARAEALEVAYNPNDCPEARWGAPAGSAELATCNRRAPADQQARMETYRAWFHARARPTE